ncbi:transcriptional regulator [Rhodococcus rhodnii]|uniref:ArsR family transcriptional regulator n=2 Tax=Rhodococcus rhodnii TaxID=38312 RepID=R7WQE7_9NOCA|nr:helix-turn-helix transcriptional regulator [Rhodococcus rhodnii]EOM76209.1 ArsR family transcriptional regulator [Rhodococcus rhodnii LMG 5362]TXG90767.1 transcriptional regulator [Rhodococcus rhodnii]
MADQDGHPDRDEFDLSSILHALSDANRRSVIVQLAEEPDGTEQLCTVFGLPWAPSTRTHHFRVLREAGLVRQRDVGNGRLTSLRRSDLDAVFPGLLDQIVGADRKGRADKS